jgi:hypothetical protein
VVAGTLMAAGIPGVAGHTEAEDTSAVAVVFAVAAAADMAAAFFMAVARA